MARSEFHLTTGSYVPGTKWRLVQEIARGGMGVTWEVRKEPGIRGASQHEAWRSCEEGASGAPVTAVAGAAPSVATPAARTSHVVAPSAASSARPVKPPAPASTRLVYETPDTIC